MNEIQEKIKAFELNLQLKYPYYLEIINPLLCFIYENGGDNYTVKAKETYTPLAEYFNLSKKDELRPASEIYKSNRTTPYWNLLIYRAKYMAAPNLIHATSRGVWTLTNFGIKTALEFTNKCAINIDQLKYKTIEEGKTTSSIATKFERSIIARNICLSTHGYTCTVCKTSMESIYGEIGKNYIHVHHITPLSSIRQTYKINPRTDLIPVCPNCHAMLHRRDPPFSTSELKLMIKS